MNDEEYKNNLSDTNSLPYTTLNVTLKELTARGEIQLASEIQRILNENAIEKPKLHEKPGDVYSSYYKVDLQKDDVLAIIDLLLDLEASFVNKSGETTPTASFYASLVDQWSRFIEYE